MNNSELHKLLSDFYAYATEGDVCKHEIINGFIDSIYPKYEMSVLAWKSKPTVLHDMTINELIYQIVHTVKDDFMMSVDLYKPKFAYEYTQKDFIIAHMEIFDSICYIHSNGRVIDIEHELIDDIVDKLFLTYFKIEK